MIQGKGTTHDPSGPQRLSWTRIRAAVTTREQQEEVLGLGSDLVEQASADAVEP